MPIGPSPPETAIDRLSRLSVEVNGLIIPGRSIENALTRHAMNLVVNNDDEMFKVSLVGSATAVRYRGREIMLVTQHQLQDVDQSRVAMMTDSGSHVITSSGRRGYLPHPDSDSHDIVAFDFTAPCRDWPELKTRFFNLTRAPPDVLSDQVLAILLLGYPSAVQRYEVHENNHLGFARLHVPCLPYSQPSDAALLHVKPTQPLSVDPDGMSGGPAFVIQYGDRQLSAYFQGMIVRGGREDFYILKAGVVLAFLDSLIDSW